MAREYYNLTDGGTADKGHPIINRQTDQARILINRILEVNATAQVNIADILRLDEMQEDTDQHTITLQRQVDAAQEEIRQLREYQVAQEKRWKSQDEAGPSNRCNPRCK
ncbi:unnamed protein product [Lactuca saligna]|uniref:Uncharacterized protein n=1 Tax=Lactuca saligna TaxID=75948 RepID=A0AA36E4I8_LACSI|nr:unnamed protein product [Lactuca saligna]